MTDLPPLATAGRRFGLGRAGLPTAREHCKRCAEITERADQMLMNYILANGRQVEIINRLMKDPDGAREVHTLGMLLAEKDSLITAIYAACLDGGELGDLVRNTIDTYKEEVRDGDGPGGEEASGS